MVAHPFAFRRIFLGWCFFRFVYATYFRWQVFNSERVPLKGPVILASNHASFIDPPLVGSGVHRGINYLARESLFRFPGVGWLLRKWNSVPVDRDGGGAASLKADPRPGSSPAARLFLFPEGTRTRISKLQPARSGIRFNRDQIHRCGYCLSTHSRRFASL